jgi:hypothetical protein
MVEDQFGVDCLYQHDNAPCHKARSVRERFVDNRVPEMDCPAQSPDLNPTEHLWGELERRLRSRPQRPTSLTALATALQEAGAAIPPETFRRLAGSLPDRVRGVIKAKGGPPSINVHDWEVRITVSSRCPDAFDEIVYKMLGNSSIAELLANSEEGLSCMELIISLDVV